MEFECERGMKGFLRYIFVKASLERWGDVSRRGRQIISLCHEPLRHNRVAEAVEKMATIARLCEVFPHRDSPNPGRLSRRDDLRAKDKIAMVVSAR